LSQGELLASAGQEFPLSKEGNPARAAGSVECSVGKAASLIGGNEMAAIGQDRAVVRWKRVPFAATEVRPLQRSTGGDLSNWGLLRQIARLDDSDTIEMWRVIVLCGKLAALLAAIAVYTYEVLAQPII
jgi:hypothetical protein